MIPAELRQIPQWVCARNGSKVPMKAFEFGAASSSDPATWSDWKTAEEAVAQGVYDNVGFVFHDNGIVGIDIDCGFDEEGLLSPLAIDIISACGSYTEFSRSGRGFHILLKGNLPFDGKNNRNGVEIYRTKRYFILTGLSVAYPEVLVENQPAIDYVVEKYFQMAARENAGPGTATDRVYTPQWKLPVNGRVQLRPVYPRIPEGSRNLCLTSLAGMLHSQGYSKRQIYDELLYANAAACEPELSKGELRSIVNSVMRYKR